MSSNNPWDNFEGNNQGYYNGMYDKQQDSPYVMPQTDIRENAAQRSQAVVSQSFLIMFVVLLISAVSAFMTASTSLFYLVMENYMVFAVAELATVFIGTWTIKKNYAVLSGIMLFAFSIINGMTLSSIFYVYDMNSIVSIFTIAAVIFAVMAVYGMVTKRDLTGVGAVCTMLLIGLILVGFLNIFILKSSQLEMISSVIGIGVFIGLTAYDLQKIKNLAVLYPERPIIVLAIYGALNLYLDLINIFLRLLSLFGRRN